MTDSVHVVSKADNAKHATCRVNQTWGNLPVSSIRVRTQLISLTSNNLSYARNGGPPLNWWDVYPAPEPCPAPYNDREAWGIVPAWGYGNVLDSSISDIQPGSLLWGMWPASGHIVELQLQPGEPAGHWTETSPHRSKLMTVYNHYEQVGSMELEKMQMASLCKALWGGPNLLNISTFSDRRIHPFGFGQPWSEDDADLTSAVVISLSASSKTGRSFSWEMTRNRDTSTLGPFALVQLTSAPEAVPSFDTQLPVKSAAYTDIPSAVSWAADFKPARIVVVDFGASDAVLQNIRAAIAKSLPTATVTVVAVGYENKIYTAEELQARRATSAQKVQLNTSGLRDWTIKAVGAERYYRAADETWKRCVGDATFANIVVRSLRGVEGAGGIEGAWSDLCNRRVPPSIGLVIDLAD